LSVVEIITYRFVVIIAFIVLFLVTFLILCFFV
jgi:hypothetical protein